MQSKCELVDYKVPMFMYNVDVKNKEKNTRKIQFENIIKISTSDKDMSRGIVFIQTKASDEEDEIKYTIELRGIFKVIEKNTNEDEREMILRNEGVKQLYSKLKEILNNIQSITKQKLPLPPSLDEIEPID